MKKLKFYKFINFWLYVFFSLGIPILLIADKYSLYITDTKFYVLAVGLVCVYLIIKFFWKHLLRMISYMDPGYIRSVCEEFVRVLPIFMVYIILRIAKIHIDNVIFIVMWSFISNLIGAIFSVNYMRLRLKVKA